MSVKTNPPGIMPKNVVHVKFLRLTPAIAGKMFATKKGTTGINLRSKSKGTFQFHWLSKNKIKKYAQTNNMYFAIRDGVTIEKIYEVPTDVIMPVLEAKATNSKSINGHAGFNEKKLIEEFNAKLVYDAEKFNCAYSGLTSPAAYE